MSSFLPWAGFVLLIVSAVFVVVWLMKLVATQTAKAAVLEVRKEHAEVYARRLSKYLTAINEKEPTDPSDIADRFRRLRDGEGDDPGPALPFDDGPSNNRS